MLPYAWMAICAIVVVIAVANAGPKVEPQICMDAEMREDARKIMLEAIDGALRRHTMKTFDTWMRDETDQPERAVRGMQRAMKAFVGARRTAREWSPPLCGGAQ